MKWRVNGETKVPLSPKKRIRDLRNVVLLGGIPRMIGPVVPGHRIEAIRLILALNLPGMTLSFLARTTICHLALAKVDVKDAGLGYATARRLLLQRSV